MRDLFFNPGVGHKGGIGRSDPSLFEVLAALSSFERDEYASTIATGQTPVGKGFVVGASPNDGADFHFAITPLAPSAQAGNPDPLNSLIAPNWGNVAPDGSGKIYVYFAGAGETFGAPGTTSIGWTAHDIAQTMLSLVEFEKILGYKYEITTDSNIATFKLLAGDAGGALGYFYPLQGSSLDGVGAFNVGTGFGAGFWGDAGQASLEKGGYSWITLIHEFGHAHGLDHPQDASGGAVIMEGVTSAFGDFGDFDLNQGVYTVMSYNDAWQLHPSGPSPYSLATAGFGWSGTLGALDIAALQQKYGIINPWATGDDVYLLQDSNALGTYYEAIWDTGGTDEIRYVGNRNVVIDLGAATLDYSATGGGIISYAAGIKGGFTIANGVVIENATSDGGNDSLTGNNAANVLSGGAGNDTLVGLGGDDTLIGGTGADAMAGGAGNDRYSVDNLGDTVTELAGEGFDIVYTTVDFDADSQHIEGIVAHSAAGLTLRAGNNDTSLAGGAGNDTLIGGSGNDSLYSRGAADTLIGGTGNDRYIVRNADDIVIEAAGEGHDVVFAKADFDANGAEIEVIRAAAASGLTLTASDINTLIVGATGADTLNGGAGDDYLIGGKGTDAMTGGGGRDRFGFDDGDSSASIANADHILDFSQADRDRIDVYKIDAIAGGGDDAFTFIGSSAFNNVAGELRYEQVGGETHIFGDTDGNGVADFAIVLDNTVTLVAADFIL